MHIFFLLGNGSFSQIEATSRIKQEAVDGVWNDKKPPSARSRSASVDREVKSSEDNSLHEFPRRSSPEKIKRKYSNHEPYPPTSRQENYSRPESVSRPEDIVTSPSSLRGPESRLFQPDERIRNLHFEALKNPRGSIVHANDLSYPYKQVYDSFQPATMVPVVESSINPVMSQRFTARRNDDLSPDGQQQSFQRETNRAPSPLYGNDGVRRLLSGEGSTVNFSRFQEKLGSGINGSQSDKPGQNVSKQQNGLASPDNNASKSTVFKKDEEPVWKTYQWYRDRKRPPSQQTKRQKAEQTIFMQYNEIRCKRVKEGKIINGSRRRASEPWLPIYSKEIDHTSPSSPKRPRTIESSRGETITQIGAIEHFVSQPLQTPSRFLANQGKVPDTSSTSPREIRHVENNVRAYSFERKSSDERHFNGNANFQCICGRENGNYTQEKTAQHVIFSRENINSRNPDHSTNGKEKVDLEISANDDGALEKISSTTEKAENIEVLPDKLRRYPQDVAKILRLNRIVKAVRNNRKRRVPLGTTKGQQTAMKTKQHEMNNNAIEHGIEDEVLTVGRHEVQLENASDSDPEIDQKCDNETAADETMEEEDEDEEERNSTRNFIDCFFFPEEPRQIRNGRTNSLAYPQSITDQESFSARQLNGLGAVQARDDSDTVCQVNGLLSLPGFKETKFNITLGELKRRMNPPETLTRVEMISYVRQAKSSGRVLLDKNNIITANRSRPTILSRVCESEAQVLADGILKMNREYLPLTTLARKTVEAYKDDDCKDKNCEDCRLKLRRRVVDVEITRLV